MKHKHLLAALCIGMVTMAGIAVVAASQSETSVTNHITTSVVNIDLETYAQKGNGLIPVDEDSGPQMLMPGMKISHIPRITNKAIDCYIRASVDITSKYEVERPITEEDISGFSEGWVQRGEYYYYTNVFRSNQSTDLFDTITVPAEWDTKYDKDDKVVDHYTMNDWDITVKIDAIQSENFNPDFESQTPWGEEGKDYEIQECIHEDGYDVTTFKAISDAELSVVYEGDSKKLIASPEDFFSGFATLTPGDSMDGTFTMKNDAEKEQAFYFKTEVLEPDNDLLDKMQLTITADGKQVYSGPLNSKDLKEYIELCKLEKGKDQKVTFQVSMPKELDNKYTLNTGKVKWYFKTVAEEKGTEKTAPVRTGDKLSVEAIIWAAVLVIAVVFLIVMKKKRK